MFVCTFINVSFVNIILLTVINYSIFVDLNFYFPNLEAGVEPATSVCQRG